VIINARWDGENMRKIPLWTKCFLLCLFAVSFSMIILTTTMYLRTYMDKEYIIRTNAETISAYVDKTVVGKLTMLEERFCGVNVAENIYKHTEEQEIREQLYTLLVDSVDVIGIYYIDNFGRRYIVGDVGGDFQHRDELILQAKKNVAYKDRGRVWFYTKTERDVNSCVLLSDIVYIGDDYSKSIIGQMLLYVDADRINEDYIVNHDEEGIVIVDHVGNIVFSTKNDWRGLNFSDNFEENKKSFTDHSGAHYISSSYKSDIKGWRNIVYFNPKVIKKQTGSLLVLVLCVLIACLIVIMFLTYHISLRFGKPIDELFQYVKVSSGGKIVVSDKIPANDAEEIRTIFDEMHNKIEQQMNDAYLAQLELKNLKIKAYESQINPHFVFNTLQIIQMMNVLGKTEQVNDMVTCLGNMMRFNLDNSSMVNLVDEIQTVENYFTILKHRYQDGFKYSIVVDEELSDCRVLKFTIQPFVENAIKHGLDGKKGVWEIFVLAKKMKDEVVFVIRDNGKGFSKEKLEALKIQLSGSAENQNGEGIGIRNVNNRIKLLFGEKFGVDIFSSGTTQVVVHMPYITTDINEEGDLCV